MKFIIDAKPGSHAALFDEVCERLNRSECIKSVPDDLDKKGFGCGFRFTNDIALTDSHPDLQVDFLECWEIDKSRASRRSMPGKREGFSFVPLYQDEFRRLMQAVESTCKHRRGLLENYELHSVFLPCK